jgi:hypothetical protein
MKYRTTAIALTGLLLLAMLYATLPKPARSTDIHNGIIVTANDTGYRVWITVYDLAKTRHMDYGWLDANGRHGWNNCCYAAGSYYYVRGEVKKLGDNRSDPETIYDTTIQVKPKLCRTAALPGKEGDPYGYARVVLKKGNGNFYWDRADNGDCTW